MPVDNVKAMETHVFLAVLAAAALHAGWNALVKGGSAKHISMAAVVIGHLPLALLSLAIFAPPAAASWPWIAAGIGVHAFYQIFLVFAYQAGDFGQVYPLARGSAPLIVTAVSVAVLGVALSLLQVAAVALIALGIISLSLIRRRDGLRNPKAALLALATGLCIATYTLVDGTAAQLSGSPVAVFGWIALGNVVTFCGFMALRHPGDLGRLSRRHLVTGLAGGSASFAAFGIVMWAFTQAPVPLVAALRETSIVFALLIGAAAFGERLDRHRLAATGLTLCGGILLRLAPG
jgi:drug/metabolite transporter (DMT)-like permease